MELAITCYLLFGLIPLLFLFIVFINVAARSYKVNNKTGH